MGEKTRLAVPQGYRVIEVEGRGDLDLNIERTEMKEGKIEEDHKPKGPIDFPWIKELEYVEKRAGYAEVSGWVYQREPLAPVDLRMDYRFYNKDGGEEGKFICEKVGPVTWERTPLDFKWESGGTIEHFEEGHVVVTVGNAVPMGFFVPTLYFQKTDKERRDC